MFVSISEVLLRMHMVPSAPFLEHTRSSIIICLINEWINEWNILGKVFQKGFLKSCKGKVSTHDYNFACFSLCYCDVFLTHKLCFIFLVLSQISSINDSWDYSSLDPAYYIYLWYSFVWGPVFVCPQIHNSPLALLCNTEAWLLGGMVPRLP